MRGAAWPFASSRSSGRKGLRSSPGPRTTCSTPTDGPSGSSRRSPRGTPSKGWSSSRSATRRGSTSGFPRGTAHSPSPTSPLARSRSSPTASTLIRAAGRSSPSTARKSCCGSRTSERCNCAGRSGRCRTCRRANYGRFSTRPSGISNGRWPTDARARSSRWPRAAARPSRRSRPATGSSSTPMPGASCSWWTATTSDGRR